MLDENGKPVEVVDEIAMMTDMLSGEITDEAKEEAKEPETKSEEVVTTEEKKEEEKAVEATEDEEKVETPVEGGEKKTEEEPKVDDKDAIIADLRSKIEELSKPKVEEPKPEEKKEEVKFVEQDFVKDVDLDDLSRDPKELNKMFNKVYQQAITDTKKSVVEGVLLSIPQIVEQHVKTMNMLKELHDSFYKENPDLEPFKKVVATVFEELGSANAGKSYKEVLALVEPEVRKRLNLHKKAVETTKKSDPPKLPSKGSRAGSISSNQPKAESLQSDIEEMLKSL